MLTDRLFHYRIFSNPLIVNLLLRTFVFYFPRDLGAANDHHLCLLIVSDSSSTAAASDSSAYLPVYLLDVIHDFNKLFTQHM